MVFNATFNNISIISWWSVLLVEETGVPGENHQTSASHWQTLSHNIVSSTSAWAEFEFTMLVPIVVIGIYYICSIKSNYHTITATSAPRYIEWCKLHKCRLPPSPLPRPIMQSTTVDPLSYGSDIIKPYCTLSLTTHSCIPSTIRKWNRLDISVRNVDSLKRFKAELVFIIIILFRNSTEDFNNCCFTF